ncbi:hypothetical protein M433DRAFT_9004 [Acidomyces richmondensis BFW]|nr:MAG: hypothetical protein FE78DRAFT_71321 [Acidomyces sp. 'richmondensis']KYG40282.1 hypothetical protein M433DRAFT_9004 [Acidomyces richmondensis BFW]
MFVFTLIATFGIIAAALSIPRQTSGGIGPLYPTNISVVFYQGGTSSNACDNVAVASGYYNESQCYAIDVDGLSISQVPGVDCTFTIYTGSSTCDAPSTSSTTSIPAGNGTTCIDTGVLDGGELTKASGVWACR